MAYDPIIITREKMTNQKIEEMKKRINSSIGFEIRVIGMHGTQYYGKIISCDDKHLIISDFFLGIKKYINVQQILNYKIKRKYEVKK